jgi:hypothetical protein
MNMSNISNAAEIRTGSGALRSAAYFGQNAQALADSLRASSSGNGVAAAAVEAGIAQCAQVLLQQAVEAELDRYLAGLKQRPDLAGPHPVVRNGHHPERILTTNVGPIRLRLPKLRGRSGNQPAFESALIARYQRRTKPLGQGAHWRFLHALLKRDWHAALFEVLGDNGFATPVFQDAGWQWQDDDLAVRNAALLKRAPWSVVWAKAFAAPLRHRLQDTATDAAANHTMLAVAAHTGNDEWQLVACCAVDRLTGETWARLAQELSAAGFKLADAVSTPVSDTRIDQPVLAAQHRSLAK